MFGKLWDGGGGQKPFEEAFDHNAKQNTLFSQYKSEASIKISWQSLFLD